MQQFWDKVDKKGPDECWPWKASRLPAGYGRININRTVVLAHRVAYELAYGPPGEGFDVHHVCANKWCVNPQHLTLLTRAEHVRVEPRNHRKNGMCRKGHHAAGLRKCLACRREKYRELRDAGMSGAEACRHA